MVPKGGDKGEADGEKDDLVLQDTFAQETAVMDEDPHMYVPLSSLFISILTDYLCWFSTFFNLHTIGITSLLPENDQLVI